VGGAGGVGVPVLVLVLAATVIASLESLPLALLAAVVLGIVQQGVIAGSLDAGVQDLIVFAVIVGVLVLRPREVTGRLAAAAGAWGAAVRAGGARLSFWLGGPAGAVAGAAAALVVGLPALRLRGLYLAITTLAFAELAQTMLFGQRMGARLLPAHLDRPSILG